MIIALIVIIFLELGVIVWLLLKRDSAPLPKPKADTTNPTSVADFYDDTTDKFLEVYGEIIQAFRTRNVENYLAYTFKSAQLEDGMKVLDAGCGVGGPAVYFASQRPNIQIDGCTNSDEQVKRGQAKVAEEGVAQQVNIKHGDFHKIDALYENEHYDRVMFLESFGHSHDKRKLIEAVWNVLKPGGCMYIKDLFRRETEDQWEQLYVNRICEEINEAYHYHIADFHEVISAIRQRGYILHFIKIPEVERSAFENLTISNEFQNLFGIGKIESWDDYVFPIDFFEILAEKPAFNLQDDMHLYFMNRK